MKTLMWNLIYTRKHSSMMHTMRFCGSGGGGVSSGSMSLLRARYPRGVGYTPPHRNMEPEISYPSPVDRMTDRHL